MPLDDSPVNPSGSEAAMAGQRKLAAQLHTTREVSLKIAASLSAEDQTVQAHDDASPAKWHLAHTTWFFEELVLKRFLPGYRVFDERFAYCFNSYYESMGPRHPRPRRGLLTRPSAEEVRAYRAYADENLQGLLAKPAPQEALSLAEMGIHHEQQHQELMLTDILALFAANPLRPVYREGAGPAETAVAAGHWRQIPGGIYDIGHRGESFAYDNEGPAHSVLLQDFRIFSREVTNGEWIAFMKAGGYSDALLWLADGWATVQREGWQAPGYWESVDGAWYRMTLHGLQPVRMDEPVMHVSFYEADAFARWAGHRLPTEFEWEAGLANGLGPAPFDLSRLFAKPASAEDGASPCTNVWEWTQSAYLPYPGYKPVPGPLGEYNGKFMCNQFVLRGGSFATPDNHLRPTYRNFFYPHQRWQFMGLRLASDA
ncbi:MAG: ergothioneine biosynthesis protein EgtB [Rhodomicrobium sp.]